MTYISKEDRAKYGLSDDAVKIVNLVLGPNNYPISTYQQVEKEIQRIAKENYEKGVASIIEKLIPNKESK